MSWARSPLSTRWVGPLVGFLLTVATVGANAYSVHFVTFNVKDNNRMPGGEFDAALVKSLLSLDGVNGGGGLKDVYAIGLQENCFQCNRNNLPKVAQIFLEQLNQQAKAILGTEAAYEFVNLAATRSTKTCELVDCNSMASRHGTSLTIVLARKGLVKATSLQRRNGCMEGNWLTRNTEKGLAGLKLTMADSRKLCFISGHLDSKSAKARRDCISSFFGAPLEDTTAVEKRAPSEDDYEEDPKWSQDCSAIFLAGDFNTRTADKDKEGPKVGSTASFSQFQALIELDELSGSKPYTGISLLKHIQSATKLAFVEPKRPIVDLPSFVATYSIEPSDSCRRKTPCYVSSRPISWTDRIVCYKCGKVESYGPVLLHHDRSDHLPVVGTFDNV